MEVQRLGQERQFKLTITKAFARQQASKKRVVVLSFGVVQKFQHFNASSLFRGRGMTSGKRRDDSRIICQLVGLSPFSNLTIFNNDNCLPDKVIDPKIAYDNLLRLVALRFTSFNLFFK
jgi:hypothetical protein